MNTCYNRNESQKHYVESKNPDTKEYIVFDSTYISLWTGKTKSMMTETKMLLKGIKQKYGLNFNQLNKIHIGFFSLSDYISTC